MTDRPILFSGSMVRALLAGTKTQTRRIMKPQPTREWAPSGGWMEIHGRDKHGELDPDRVLGHGYCSDDGEEGYASPYGVPGDRLWVRETLRRSDFGWYYGADVEPLKLAPELRAVATSWAHHKEGDVCVSIHMPRWASRITLEITGVRVERLQDISEDDAVAEGLARIAVTSDTTGTREAYRQLWNEINGAGAWYANPWVWVVGFKRAEGFARD